MPGVFLRIWRPAWDRASVTSTRYIQSLSTDSRDGGYGDPDEVAIPTESQPNRVAYGVGPMRQGWSVMASTAADASRIGSLSKMLAGVTDDMTIASRTPEG